MTWQEKLREPFSYDQTERVIVQGSRKLFLMPNRVEINRHAYAGLQAITVWTEKGACRRRIKREARKAIKQSMESGE